MLKSIIPMIIERFIITISVIAVILIGMPMRLSSAEIGILRDTGQQIVVVNGEEIANIFPSTANLYPATFIVIYTSWCTSCIRKFSDINALISKYKNVNAIVISLDKNKSQLIRFLKKYKSIDFIPYNISPTDRNMKILVQELRKKQCYFDGAIPYTTVLNRKNHNVITSNNTKILESSVIKMLEEK